MSFDYDVFLSYNREDASIVESIATRLTGEAALRVFLDKWCLVPGEPWQDEIEAALDRSATCVVFVGPHGPSPWAHMEMRAALELRAKERMLRVIPTLLPGADKNDKKSLPLFLKSLTWVDYTGGPSDSNAFEAIKAGVLGYAPGPPNILPKTGDKGRSKLGIVIRDSLLPVTDFQSRPELSDLHSFWSDDSRLGILALVGIGGSGKTALVSRLLQEIPHSEVDHQQVPKARDLPPPEGIFVWSFYDRPDVELFIQSLHEYFTGTDTVKGPARDLTYRLIRFLEKTSFNRILIVLDGLEVVQESQDSVGSFGVLRDSSLRHLIRRFAQGELGVRLLITSRFPFPDLVTFQGLGYWVIETDNLDQLSARNLLRSRGVVGGDGTLDELIRDYGNHALTLDHLGTLLRDFFDGDPRRARELPPVGTARGDAYAEYQAYRLARVFSFYEAHLPPTELGVLEALCVFRVPVSFETIVKIFANEGEGASSAIPRLTEVTVRSILAKLRSRRLISFYGEKTEAKCSVHPAIRDHFYRAMGATSADIHAAARQHLIPLEARPDREKLPLDPISLDLMEEYIYHSTRSGHTEDALQFYERSMGGYTHFAWRLGDYQRGLRVASILVDAGGIELGKEIFHSRPWLDRSLFHLDLGRPTEAELQLRQLLAKHREEIHTSEYLKRIDERAWLFFEAMLLQSLSDTLVAQGKLVEAETILTLVIDKGGDAFWTDALLARFETGSDPFGRRAACRCLLGRVSASLDDFSTAQSKYVDSPRWNHYRSAVPGRYAGAFHAMLLTRLGSFSAALELLRKCNLPRAREVRPLIAAQYDLAFAGVYLDVGQITEASQHLDSALAWAIDSGHQEVYTRATVAKAKMALRTGNLQESQIMLREAEQVARISSFRVCLVDVLVATGHLGLKNGDLNHAATTGKEAYDICGDPECGYAWGRGNAAHLLALVARSGGDEKEALRNARNAIAIRKALQDPKINNTQLILDTVR